MAPICPRLYFFMAHQCRTWCPSSIGEGRGFSFLPPRETTIRVQQTPEVPGITGTFHIRVFHSMPLNQTQEWSPTLSKPFLLELWKNETTHQKEKTMPVGNLSCLQFASHVFSCRLDFCVDSTHLGIQTLPWPAWCLNQWGNQLSPLDPSGHTVPAKQGKMHARHLMYNPQYGCRSDLPIKLFPFCSQTVYCWGSQCFLILSWCNLDMCDQDFFLETDSQPWIQALEEKNKAHILTSRRRFHSAMHRSNFHLIPHLVSIYL